ncbi:PREDICTED: uncharacterized protein LOC107345759 [Acropora digitifera]|uniref:uncharacterized protein LOC107345759 n=1 Tax=Acropora digitifera TaxID=70779 RepID=UPI00077A0541|nr:PREDICTED: uncharacterized protein LOC107345759 [Acropora digitifera]XP_015766987.1 PREDICTED: uncharacterized protein LOC107345759 [Acropora digitifera]
MKEIPLIYVVVALLSFTKGQYTGYQYQPYPPYYKMAPVYSWYQRDQEPAAEVKMEPDSKDIVPFEVQGLLYHNIHRNLHKADDLQLDHQLSLDASSYARTIARRLVVRHAPIQSRPGRGENIFLSCKAFSHGVLAFEAVKEWVS